MAKSIYATLRIGIIGGGAAGISMAYYLKRNGYIDVTVLEKESVPGGKCCSYTHEDGIYELGAVLGTWDYTATLDLMKEADIEPMPSPDYPKSHKITELYNKGVISLDNIFPGYLTLKEAPKLLRQVAKYRKLSKKYSRLYEAGLDNIPHELYEPFNKWVKKHNMRELAKIMEIPFTTFGYGYFNEVPAAYVLKYMDFPTVMSLIKPHSFFNWKDGVQNLWKKLSQNINIRLNEEVIKVERGSKVFIKTTASEYEFDYIIFTSPLDETLKFMDATEIERDLFSKIEYYNYFAFTCFIDDFPYPGGIIPENFKKENRGGIMIWDNRKRDNNLYTLYVIGEPGWEQSDIEERVEAEITSLGGKMGSVQMFKKWKYFPHVSPKELKHGFYEKLELIQGENKTYYAGEVMNFSTVELTCRYSEEIVKRFFK